MGKNEKISNFWFGFSLGTFFTSFFIFLFGTRKGREIIKKFLEFSENFEESLLNIFKELEINFKETQKQHKIDQHHEPKIKTNLMGVIDRIKFLTHPTIKKQTKKFFIKNGKIIEKSP